MAHEVKCEIREAMTDIMPLNNDSFIMTATQRRNRTESSNYGKNDENNSSSLK